METQRHIFLVDDDPDIRDLAGRVLMRSGLKVTSFADGESMLARLDRLRPDLLLLDVMLPGDSGLVVCRRLREQKDDLPIILLTALGDVDQRIAGFEDGADDYVVKPFEPRELALRIAAVLRRRESAPGAPRAHDGPAEVGAAVLDPARRILVRDGEAVPLSDGEFALLRALMRHPYAPLTRARIAELARADGAAINDRSIDVAVHRLRRLVEAADGPPAIIQTVRGVGYVFTPEA